MLLELNEKMYLPGHHGIYLGKSLDAMAESRRVLDACFNFMSKS